MDAKETKRIFHEAPSHGFFEGSVNVCFEKCVVSPGSDLSEQEKACLATCQDAYQQAAKFIIQKQLKTLTERLRQAYSHKE